MFNIKLNNIRDIKKSKIDSQLINLTLIDGVWLAGGSIRSLITREIPNDYDFFFKDNIAVNNIKEKLDSLGYIIVFVCPLGHLITLKKENIKVQLITSKYYESIIQLLNTFDFTVTTAGIEKHNLFINKDFIRDTRKKLLKINKLTYPVATLNRLYKYKKYGYNFMDCLVDIVDRVSRNDPNILDLTFLYMD